jgi:acid phosphatase
MRKLRFALVAAALVLAVGLAGSAGAGRGNDQLSKIDHIVVIYEENHSFDNLYGGWEGVRGRADAEAAQTAQIDQNGVAYTCLKQLDVNLTSPPLAATCTDSAHGYSSAFLNEPFRIDAFVQPEDKTCPQPGVFAPNGLLPSDANLPGGCTRDIVHRFYQEQYQLDGGRQDRYTTGSDAAGLTQGYYDTNALPIYQYLHSGKHPHYAIADEFFQAAFGGSFLNHQWLVAAASPTYAAAPESLHSILDANGFPNAGYPLYQPATTVRDAALTQACGASTTVAGFACGDYAVNTIQPTSQPHGSGTQLPLQAGTTIGDELTSAGVSWAWYGGGWSNAAGDVGAPGWTNTGLVPNTCADPNSSPNPTYPYCPNKVFQYHHQPFNYFAQYAPSTPGRSHLRDEQEFISLASSSSDQCKLDSVSFVKPIGLENEHPGYTSEIRGSDHLVSLLEAIDDSACAKDTMVIVTYDEFGGQWDHVSPPGQGQPPCQFQLWQPGGVTPCSHDQWGPGTRIPTLVVSPFLRGNFVVDHTQYDTTSILATIESRWGLHPLSSRDAAASSLSNVFAAKQYEAAGP